MDKFQVNFKTLIVVFFFLSPIALSDHVKDNDEDSIMTKVYTHWDKVKSMAQEAQKKIIPPNLEIQEKVAEKVKETPSTEGIKDAAKKSLEDGHATLEKTAESAATVVDDAVHKAKDKVKETPSTEGIKDAAKKSLEKGQATLEKTAESANTVMNDVVHKAKDKVEDKLPQEVGHNVDEL